MRKIIAFLAATALTYVLAVLLVGQFNIAQIVALGYAVTAAERWGVFVHDAVAMLSSYLPLITIALLIAWLFTGQLLNRLVSRSAWLYALAGFTAILVLHLTLTSVFDIHPVAPTRTWLGLLAQAVVGAFGGWFFHHFAFKGVAN